MSTQMPLRTGVSDTYPAPDNATARTAFGKIWDYIKAKSGTDMAPAAIADSATPAIGAAASTLITLAGTTTITGFDTVESGVERTVTFSGIRSITYDGTAMILPGSASITTAVGDVAKFLSLGSGNWKCTSYRRANGQPIASLSVGHHEVCVHTGNGHGSTNTKVRRYSTAMVNTGSAITYADSGTAGASFTIATGHSGLYSIQTTDRYTGGSPAIGISKNSNALTTSIDLIAVATRIAQTQGANNAHSTVSATVWLDAGDVIRPHDDGQPDQADDRVMFRITKVGV